jgi:hypothetical protein
VGTSSIQRESKDPGPWLPLDQIAVVEVTSEDRRYPIESVFHPHTGPGWRAAGSGEQRIRIFFDDPVTIRRIHLRFVEPDFDRSQEFVIRWASADGGLERELVRQQWNFSPPATG